MIYQRAVPVSKDRHRDMSVRTGDEFGFAADMNAVPLLIAEFEQVSREYPIIFNETNDGFIPAALVGLRDGENLLISAEQGWDAKYIPAYIRRYPFVFSQTPDGDTFNLCIDEGFSGCNLDGEGDALFDNDGETSNYLQGMLDFTTSYQHDLQLTAAFCERLDKLDLLTPGEVNFQLGDGKNAVTSGMLMVDRERLASLTGNKLSDLAKSGDLEMIYAHLISLGNVDVFRDRLSNL